MISFEMENERSFLHTLANPLATAQFALDSAIQDISEITEFPPHLLESLQKAFNAVEQASELLRQRRDQLIKAGVPPSHT